MGNGVVVASRSGATTELAPRYRPWYSPSVPERQLETPLVL